MTAAVEDIYLEYYDRVLAYVRGKVSDAHEAEDLVSAVFLKIHQKIHTFDPEKASLSTWIYTVARNTVTDHYRTHRLHIGYEDAVQVEMVAGEDSEQLEELAEALAKLKERERDLIVLHYYSSYTLKEVAQKMGMSYINAKVVHKKALTALKGYLLEG